MATSHPTRPCQHCGIEFTGQRNRQYCSTKCRNARNAQRRTNEQRDRVIGTCQRCGAEFNKDRKANPTYCEPCARRKVTEEYKLRFTKHWPQCKVYFPTCPQCMRTFSAKRDGKTYCSKACARNAAREPNTCRDCGNRAEPFKTYCKSCRLARHKASERAYKQKRRAITRGVNAEHINPLTIYERDNWTCGICGKPVDKRLGYPDHKSATIDHIIPIAQGGTHTQDNVQCAHWDCNIYARDKAIA